MASSDIWAEFEGLRQNIRHNTVDRLKQILSGLNDECHAILFKSGKKQDLIDRIVAQLDQWRQTNNVEKWIRAKAVLHLVRNSGMYTPNKMPPAATLSAVAAPHIPHNSANSSGPSNYSIPITSSRYDHFPQPRKPTGFSGIAHPGQNFSAGIRFKPSPFLRVDQVISSVIECPESSSASDRRSQSVSFTLSNEHIAKLKSTSSRYQLRLYCTSSSFYSSGPNAFRTNTGPCPVEFPPTCEVRVNTIQLAANLKGLKKKPGTAPPADLGKIVRLITTSPNRVEMVYVNSQQPSQPKKYYLVVMLVEVTSVAQLVDRLRKGKYQSSQDVLANVKVRDDDDDIVAGPQKMSLKCPLSFARIQTPCRSSQCVHPQCFDAMSWFSVMEQTTTWLCPVCEKTLDPEDLIMDGYFDEILKETPDSVDDIMVEADGEWHTTDNKYASMRWKVSHSPSATAGSSSPRKIQPSVKSRSESPTKSDDSKARPGEEIVILDSDDEDEGRVKRELSPSFASASSGNRSHSNFLPIQPSAGDIIDLTLDSDDEGSPTQPTFSSSSGPSSSRIIEKRKAPELDLPPLAPKKSRADDNDTIMRVMAMRTLTVPANGNTSGAGREHASAFRQRSSNPLPPPRYAHNASASAPSRFPARYEGSSAYHNHHPFRESPSATRGPANSAPSPGSSYSTWSPWSQ